MSQNRSSAVMQQRAEPRDSLDYFPTPPWATRAFMTEWLMGRTVWCDPIWEPAAGCGHMADVLREAYPHVTETDVADYGRGYRLGSFVGEGPDVIRDVKARWVITNPPFNLAVEFALRALELHCSVALLLRSVWAEGAERHERLFRHNPPTDIVQYADRVPMVKGRWDPQASTATSYAWFVWRTGARGVDTRFFWIAPGARRRCSKPDDIARFASRGL